MLTSGLKLARRILQKLFAVAGRSLLGTITRVETTEPVVALTFDDGPDPDYTPRLLQVLAEHHARATFFVVGEAARRCPELVKRIADAGHAIGNHSWNHPSFPLISGRERRHQIRACAEAIPPYGERLFRPPYGDQNIASRLDALVLGHKVVMFDVATDDWCGGDAETVARQIERQLHPGSVIVLHDRLFDALKRSYFERQAMIDAVRMLLARVGGKYRFVTVPELFSHGKPHNEFWYKEPDVELLNNLTRPGTPGRRYPTSAKHGWSSGLRNILLEHQRR
jgi:peptidoglycan/xylan/chitin deacetylase (PgdA/CDA1 family)